MKNGIAICLQFVYSMHRYTKTHLRRNIIRGICMRTNFEIDSKEQSVAMNIALSIDDKRFLKVYAAEHDTTVATVITDCIMKLREESKQ